MSGLKSGLLGGHIMPETVPKNEPISNEKGKEWVRNTAHCAIHNAMGNIEVLCDTTR